MRYKNIQSFILVAQPELQAAIDTANTINQRIDVFFAEFSQWGGIESLALEREGNNYRIIARTFASPYYSDVFQSISEGMEQLNQLIARLS